MVLVLLSLFVGGCTGRTHQVASSPAATTSAAPHREIITEPIAITPEVVGKLQPQGGFQLGIEREREDGYSHLRNRRVVLVANNSSVDRLGYHTAERFVQSKDFTFKRLVLLSDDRATTSSALLTVLDQYPNLPVSYLNRAKFRLDDEMLRGADAIAFDAALSGIRVDIETVALGAALQEATLRNIKIVVFDRPTAIFVTYFEGPPADVDMLGSREAILPIPMVPGLTVGELANLANKRFGLQADLVVVPMTSWTRFEANNWLTTPLSEGVLTKLRGSFRYEVSLTPPFQYGFTALATTLDLTDPEMWDLSRVEAEPYKPAKLILVPRGMTAGDLLGKLSEQNPTGATLAIERTTTETGTTDALTIIPSGAADILPVELSLQLRFALKGATRNKVEGAASDPYGTRLILQAFERGLTPEQIRRRWSVSSDYKNYSDLRQRYLLYPNEKP